TMNEQVATSSTLYFQCRKKTEGNQAEGVERDASKPGKLHNDLIHCAFQVAAYGSKAAAETLQKELRRANLSDRFDKKIFDLSYVHVCYYCVDSKAKKEQINTRDKVCKALIEVKGVPKPDHAASSGTAAFSTNMLVMAGAILISSALVMSISA
ncbi:SAG-related sequence protein SRS48Q, partial [Toxoplasma gondii CAST]